MAQHRILIIGSLAKSLTNFRGDLIKHLLNNNFKVFCAAPNFDKHTTGLLKELGVCCEELTLSNTGLNPFKDLRSIVQLSTIIKKHEIDVVFPYTIKPVIYGSIAAGLNKVPVISLITGLGFTFSGATKTARILQKITSMFYRIALKYNSMVLFQNKDDLQLFIDQKIIPPTKKHAVVHGSGINLDKFGFLPRKKSPGEPVRFIIVGRLIAEKGAQLFMDAAKQLKKEYPLTEFHIVGTSSNRSVSSVSMEEVTKLAVENTINYYGYQPEIIQCLNNADIFVLPTYYREGVPRSILEALSCGMPVITTHMPGCKETVIEGENGFLIPPRELDPLIEAIRYFILNPSEIEIMGRRSRQLAESKFDVTLINEQILQNIRISL